MRPGTCVSVGRIHAFHGKAPHTNNYLFLLPISAFFDVSLFLCRLQLNSRSALCYTQSLSFLPYYKIRCRFHDKLFIQCFKFTMNECQSLRDVLHDKTINGNLYNLSKKVLMCYQILGTKHKINQ